jgi:antitoxin component of MazEF toxin-antitoxin module
VVDFRMAAHKNCGMTKTITKIGNSQGIIFDAALMKLAKLKAGDYVNVELHNCRTIPLTPL